MSAESAETRTTSTVSHVPHVHGVIVAKDSTEFAALSAELIARAIDEAVVERGRAKVALSGGTTPLDAYKHLSTLDLPWHTVDWFQVDERCVPRDSERSNFRALSSALGFEQHERGKAHRLGGDNADPELAAGAYQNLLRQCFGVASAVSFDVLTLGIGEDGHTASLFPSSGAVTVDDRLVLAVPEQADKGIEARLSLTAPVLLEARLIVVMARGANKREMVAAARLEGSEDELPARVLQRAKGRVIWVLDKDAAG